MNYYEQLDFSVLIVSDDAREKLDRALSRLDDNGAEIVSAVNAAFADYEDRIETLETLESLVGEDA